MAGKKKPGMLVDSVSEGRLIKRVAGKFSVVPLSGAFEIRFKGYATLHWAFYYFVPLWVISADIEDRIEIFLRNFSRRVSYIEAKAKSPGSSK